MRIRDRECGKEHPEARAREAEDPKEAPLAPVSCAMNMRRSYMQEERRGVGPKLGKG